MFTDSPARSGSTIGDFAGDGHGFGDRADAQRERRRRCTPLRRTIALLDRRSEIRRVPLSRRRWRAADSTTRIEPVGVADRAELAEHFGALQGDGDAGKDRAAAVDDSAEPPCPSSRAGPGPLRELERERERTPGVHEYACHPPLCRSSQEQIRTGCDSGRAPRRAAARRSSDAARTISTAPAAPMRRRPAACRGSWLSAHRTGWRHVNPDPLSAGDAGLERARRCVAALLSSTRNAVRPSVAVVAPAMPSARPDQNIVPLWAVACVGCSAAPASRGMFDRFLDRWLVLLRSLGSLRMRSPAAGSRRVSCDASGMIGKRDAENAAIVARFGRVARTFARNDNNDSE